MKKKLIRLTESDLHRIIENSVRRVLKETKISNKRGLREEYDDVYVNGSYNDDDEFENGNDEFNKQSLKHNEFNHYDGEMSEELRDALVNELEDEYSDGVVERELRNYFENSSQDASDSERLINVLSSKLNIPYEEVSDGFNDLYDLYNEYF